jgi:dephospho-CoA kinase
MKVGLTGGIASGKSIVGEMFVSLGAHLIQADQIARKLMSPGEPVYDEVVSHFGEEILNPDGTINRATLAEAAFGTTGSGATDSSAIGKLKGSRVGELNALVHPAVVRRQTQWMHEVENRDPRAIAIVEAALILEAGAAKSFDRLIVVTCNEEQRIARFAARQKLDLDTARKEVRRRMAAQLPEAEKIKVAEYVIDNSGSLDRTRAQVERIWKTFIAKNV